MGMEAGKGERVSAPIDVLIVGAGPVGLTCSILLSRLGLSNRVLEGRPMLHAAPQAHVVSGRSMEIFRAAGVDSGDLAAVSSPLADISNVQWVHTLAGPELGRFQLVNPERALKMLSAGPAPMANISQHRLEPVLLEKAVAEGATVSFECEWRDFEPGSGGAVSVVRDLARGKDGDVFSRFVLGCDGAGSSVRRALGIEMEGPRRVETFLNVHLKANLRPLLRGREAILYWHVDSEVPGVFIAHEIESTWVFMTPIAASGESWSEAECRDLVGNAIGADVAFEIQSIDTWVMTAQVASAYGRDPVFLAGDAAHRFPPMGGLGMNTGIADVFNLAWKLAAVRRGDAPPSLLQTYETERRPCAQASCKQSLANHHKMSEVWEALDVSPAMEAGKLRQRLRSLSEDPERKARVQGAIDAQAAHFDTIGLDLGQIYENGAILPDGTPPPEQGVSIYQANSRPGSHLPHAWIEREGERVSTLDLLDPQRPTVLVGPAGKAWLDAARSLGLAAVSIGEGAEVSDPDGAWEALRGTQRDGALLVRPDFVVAWRAAALASDPAEALASALHRILGSQRPRH